MASMITMSLASPIRMAMHWTWWDVIWSGNSQLLSCHGQITSFRLSSSYSPCTVGWTKCWVCPQRLMDSNGFLNVLAECGFWYVCWCPGYLLEQGGGPRGWHNFPQLLLSSEMEPNLESFIFRKNLPCILWLHFLNRHRWRQCFGTESAVGHSQTPPATLLFWMVLFFKKCCFNWLLFCGEDFWDILMGCKLSWQPVLYGERMGYKRFK